MQIRHVAVINRLGLHARACAQIVRHAARFRARVSLQFRGRCANARSKWNGASITMTLIDPSARMRGNHRTTGDRRR
jgi:phosphotransferase system HPr (HPr) family protein